MMPGQDGYELTKEIKKNLKTPVILLTAKGEVENRIKGLELGADDYIIKPFDFAELEARCRAVLRRHTGSTQTQLVFGNIALNPLTAELQTPKASHILRNRELRLLEIFMNTPDILFTKEQLTDRIFNISESVNENTIEVYIGRVRKKLTGCDVHIQTMRGIGYKLTQS